jgi:hypothetical protein
MAETSHIEWVEFSAPTMAEAKAAAAAEIECRHGFPSTMQAFRRGQVCTVRLGYAAPKADEEGRP